MKCANYLNQVAIDLAIREANRRLMEIDKASGIENPKPLYEEGTNCCLECAAANNPDWINDMFNEAHGGDAGFLRICYKENKQ